MDPLVIALGLAAAAGDLVGGAILAAPRRIGDRTLGLLMALGAGNLLGVSLIELVPESIALVGAVAPLYILGGYLLIHFFEHVFAPHLHFGEETHGQAVVDTHVTSTASSAETIVSPFSATASGALPSDSNTTSGRAEPK